MTWIKMWITFGFLCCSSSQRHSLIGIIRFHLTSSAAKLPSRLCVGLSFMLLQHSSIKICKSLSKGSRGNPIASSG